MYLMQVENGEGDEDAGAGGDECDEKSAGKGFR
jgi:hypothetical protein